MRKTGWEGDVLWRNNQVAGWVGHVFESEQSDRSIGWNANWFPSGRAPARCISGPGSRDSAMVALEEACNLTDQWPLGSLSADQFLDKLPLYAGVVRSGDEMRGASDEKLTGWSLGIQDTTNHVKRMIAEWRKANNRTHPAPETQTSDGAETAESLKEISGGRDRD